MVQREWVEMLRKQANVSAQDAERALEASNGDMLDAIMLLEKEGAVPPPEQGGEFRTQAEPVEPANPAESRAGQFDTRDEWQQERARWEETRERERADSTIPPQEGANKYFQTIKIWLRKGNENYLIVGRKERQAIRVSLNVLILLVVLAYRPIGFLALVALVTGHYFRMEGPDFAHSDINEKMQNVSDATERIKRNIIGEDDTKQ